MYVLILKDELPWFESTSFEMASVYFDRTNDGITLMMNDIISDTMSVEGAKEVYETLCTKFDCKQIPHDIIKWE